MSLDEYPIDDDYIGVEERPAAVEQSDEYRHDASYTYDRSEHGTSGDETAVIIDKKRVVERDDRGGTRTGFLAEDVNGGHLSETVVREGRPQPRARWLMTLQDGYRDISLSRAQQNADADKRSYIQTFTSTLEMNDYQRKRVSAVVESVNMGHMAHYPSEIVILAIISIVANEDDRWIRDEDAFKDLVRDLDGSMEDVKNARRLVKGKSKIL